ncbi:MAG: DMT family transporter [Proteobacteria bacterium]|nr:DMT family transporter [Pseudomonadota bacterium]
MKDNTKAAISMLIASLLFAIMMFIARYFCSDLSGFQTLGTRGLLNSIMLLPFLRKRHFTQSKRYYKELLIRGTLGSIGACLIFQAILLIPLANAASLTRSASLFVPFIAAIFIAEKLKLSRVFYAILGFTGALLIIKPSFEKVELGGIMALASAAFNAGAFVTIRHVSKKVDTQLTMFWFLSLSAFYTFVFFGHTFKPLTETQFFYLFIISIFGFFGQYFMTTAYALAPATIVAPWQNSEVIFTAILGMTFLQQYPDLISVCGMILVAIAAVKVTTT